MRRIELAAATAFGTAERLHRVGVLPAPASELAFVVYPWTVAADRLRRGGLGAALVERRLPGRAARGRAGPGRGGRTTRRHPRRGGARGGRGGGGAHRHRGRVAPGAGAAAAVNGTERRVERDRSRVARVGG